MVTEEVVPITSDQHSGGLTHCSRLLHLTWDSRHKHHNRDRKGNTFMVLLVKRFDGLALRFLFTCQRPAVNLVAVFNLLFYLPHFHSSLLLIPAHSLSELLSLTKKAFV